MNVTTIQRTDQASFTVQRAQTPLDRRDQIVDVVVSRLRHSETYFSGVRHRLPRLYDMWRGIWTGRFHPHKNNIHIPIIYSAIWADAALKAGTSLMMWPPVSFLGYGPDDMPIARKWEGLVGAQMKDMDLFMKEVDTFVTADLYGVAITQMGWRFNKDVRIMESIETAPITNQIIRTIKKGEVVTFDGPDSEMVDRQDAFPQPGVPRIQNMKWFIRRRFIDLDECRALAKAGVFDQSELDRMVTEGGVNSSLATDLASVKRFQVRTGMDDESARFMDRYSRPVELVEMWGIVPSELAGDGDNLRVITVANRRYLFRNRPLPFWHKKLPFIAFSPTPDPHYFDAPGKAEVCEKLNIVANRFINQTLDIGDLIVDPVIFYDRGSGLNTKNLIMKPGRMIGVDGNPSEVTAPLVFNTQGLGLAEQKIEQMRRLSEMASGMQEDVVQGMEGPDRETARGMLARREAAGKRLMLESRLYEETYLEKMANMMVALDKQFLEAPVEVSILGDSATTDPVTKQQIMSTRMTLEERDLIMSYTARATGATTGLSKSMKQNNLVQLLTAMGSPIGQSVMGQINAVNFWRGIFREFEVPNINELFMVNPLLQQMVQGAGMESAGQVPTSGDVTATGALPIPSMQGVPQQTDSGLNSLLPAAA